MSAVGVDGCRAGWVVVAPEEARVEVHATFIEVLAAFPRATLAVDMPIGLLDAPTPGGRACDREARRLLPGRAACVFTPPTRAHLAASRFGEVPGLSLQSWHLLPRVREVDEALTPARQRRIVESHPELAFSLLAERVLRHPKRGAEGRRERVKALRAAFPDVGRLPTPRGAKPDDVLDACVLAWSAQRVRAGDAVRLPVRPPRDGRGLRMEIRA